MRRLLAPGGVVLLLLLPLASAAVDGLSWSSSASVEMDGVVEARAPEGIVEMEDAHASGAFALELGNGTITVSAWEVAHANVPAQYGSYNPPLGSAKDQNFSVRSSHLSVRMDDELLRFTLVAQPGGVVSLEGAGHLAGFPVRLAHAYAGYAASQVDPTPFLPYRPPPYVDWTWQAGWLFAGDYPQASAEGFPVLAGDAINASGPVSLMVIGGVATFLDGNGTLQTVQLGNHTESTSPGGVVQRETRLLFHGEARRASIPVTGHWGISGPTVQWRLRGTLDAPHATGEYRDERGGHPFQDEPLHASGDLVISPLERSAALGPFPYAASGGFDALSVGGAPVVDASPRAGLAAPAVEATLVGVALLVLLRVLAPLYTRLAPRDLLLHERRRRLHEIARQEPGLHLRELGRRAGLSWSVARFHVRMLEKGGLLRLDRRGGRARVYPAGAQTVAAALHPVAQRILDALPEDGAPLDVRDLRERVGVSRQLLSHHLDRLAEEGRVVRAGARPTMVSRPTSSSPC